MSNTISLNTNLYVKNTNTITIPLFISETTSGSNSITNATTVTPTWATIDTGSNADMLLGAFTNNTTGSKISIALGGTTNVASILDGSNIDSCMLSYSGSTAVYAKTEIGTAQLSYTLVSMN